MFIRAGKIVLDAPMDAIGERFVEVLVNADQLENARALGPIDERALPFGQTMMLFDGLPQSQLEPPGEPRTPGPADLFVATMKGTYALTPPTPPPFRAHPPRPPPPPTPP